MSNLNPKEIEQFAKDSAHWWDVNGPFKPLHKLNSVRIEYICQQIKTHFSLGADEDLKGLSIVDIGCGGGLVCESMARTGASVQGVDADGNAIFVAKEHAASQGLQIDYRHGTAEDLSEAYDVVLALEIIEHVPHPEDFIALCLKLCKPGGLIIFSTLNRTMKSYALGIAVSEYILKWVPKGTHHWKQFVKPSEIARWLRHYDGFVIDVSGIVYNVLADSFEVDSRDVDVNYFLVAGKETSAPRK